MGKSREPPSNLILTKELKKPARGTAMQVTDGH